MSTITISVDERKAKTFADKFKEVTALEAKKDAADKAMRAAQSNYNTVKMAAQSGQGDWGPVGMAHAIVMQRTQEFEKLSGSYMSTLADCQNMQKVFTEECIRALTA
jgi:hypothetical protein